MAVHGCTDSTAYNYNPLATNDDGSCCYSPTLCPTALTGVTFNDTGSHYAFTWDNMGTSSCQVGRVTIDFREINPTTGAVIVDWGGGMQMPPWIINGCYYYPGTGEMGYVYDGSLTISYSSFTYSGALGFYPKIEWRTKIEYCDCNVQTIYNASTWIDNPLTGHLEAPMYPNSVWTYHPPFISSH